MQSKTKPIVTKKDLKKEIKAKEKIAKSNNIVKK